MNPILADAASAQSNGSHSSGAITFVQWVFRVGLSLVVLLILTPSVDGKSKKNKSGSTSSRKQERSIADFIGSGSVTSYAYTERKTGSEVLADVSFSQCEPNTLPEYIISVSGNMSVQEYEGRKYLFCYGECVLALRLSRQISNSYSFEISQFVQPEERIRYHRSGVEVAFLSSIETNQSTMRSGSAANNNAKLSITSDNCSVPEVVDGKIKGYFKGTQEGVREASYSILEDPVSYSFVMDALYLRAFRGPYQVLVAPADRVQHDSAATYCVVKVSGERGPHGDVPLMIEHINVSAFSATQSLEILDGYEDCANRRMAESSRSSNEVLFREDFEGWCVGSTPVQTGFSVTDVSNSVVSWEGRHALASMNGSRIEIVLPDILPMRFALEFDLVVSENPDRTPSRVVSLRGWRSEVATLNTAGREEALPRCECSRVYLSERGNSGFSAIPGGSTPHAFSPNRAVRYRLLVDGSKLQLFAGSDQIALVTNGCWVGFDRIGIDIINSLDAPILIDNLLISR